MVMSAMTGKLLLILIITLSNISVLNHINLKLAIFYEFTHFILFHFLPTLIKLGCKTVNFCLRAEVYQMLGSKNKHDKYFMLFAK